MDLAVMNPMITHVVLIKLVEIRQKCLHCTNENESLM